MRLGDNDKFPNRQVKQIITNVTLVICMSGNPCPAGPIRYIRHIWMMLKIKLSLSYTDMRLLSQYRSKTKDSWSDASPPRFHLQDQNLLKKLIAPLIESENITEIQLESGQPYLWPTYHRQLLWRLWTAFQDSHQGREHFRISAIGVK